jgi:hypothetical protein
MEEICKQFLHGLKDSLRFWQGLKDIMQSKYLIKRLFQNTLINGVIYLGSVFLYNFFVNTLFGGGLSLSNSNNQVLSIIYLILQGVISIIYNLWIIFIYIVAMTLSTFWVQDIFDELI